MRQEDVDALRKILNTYGIATILRILANLADGGSAKQQTYTGNGSSQFDDSSGSQWGGPGGR